MDQALLVVGGFGLRKRFRSGTPMIRGMFLIDTCLVPVDRLPTRVNTMVHLF